MGNRVVKTWEWGELGMGQGGGSGRGMEDICNTIDNKNIFKNTYWNIIFCFYVSTIQQVP